MIFILSISMASVFGQSQNTTSMMLHFEQVTAFVYDVDKHDYNVLDTFVCSGPILIDPVLVYIGECNAVPNRKLNILEVGEEEETNRAIYICDENGERFAVAVTTDRKYLTVIGMNEKYVYDLKKTSHVKIENQVISENRGKKDIYVAQILEDKPIFGDANTFAESLLLVKDFLNTRLNENIEVPSGRCIVSIVISPEGKVEDVTILAGANKAFNAFAIEIVESMQGWKPGKRDNVPVYSSLNIEVKKD